jgi:hypothetical protein
MFEYHLPPWRDWENNEKILSQESRFPTDIRTGQFPKKLELWLIWWDNIKMDI